MNKNFIMAPMTIVFLLAIATAAHAGMEREAVRGVPANNGPVYAGMGGHGGMGGRGGSGMMGSGEGISSILEALLGKRSEQDRDYALERDREELRQEIRGKRRELAYLFRSDTPDKKLIDQKIVELNRLEAELDKKMYGSNNRR
jgi:hypothetical protein